MLIHPHPLAKLVKRNRDDEDGPDDAFESFDDIVESMTGSDSIQVDVRESDDRIRVVADVPSSDRDAIDVKCDGRRLAIRIGTESGPIIKRVTLPSYVDDETILLNLNNGILEIALERTTDPANIGFY